MKNYIVGFVATTLVCLNVYAAWPWSAFAHEGQLYVTTLADCNHIGAHISVPQTCRADRRTRDVVLECTVDLKLMMTEMGCPNDQKLVAKTAAIDLKKSGLSPEVKTLHIKYGEKTTTVDLSK